MKNLLLITLVVFTTPELFGQCENPFYKVKEGTIIEMQSFDKKDKIQTSSKTKVVEYNETTSGYVAKIAYTLFDKKDKMISEGEYTLECDNGIVKIDMSSFVPAESMTAFKDMEIEMEMDQMLYPASLSAGQNLDDAGIRIKTNNSPIPMSMDMDITNRKVEGKESVKTPAGTFDCYKISYDMFSKMSIMKMNFKNVEYLSENSGVVRTESYKSNGNLMSYSVLTKYEY